MIKKVKFNCSIGFAGADREEELSIEIPEGIEENETEIEEYINSYYEAWLGNFLDCGWYEVEDE